MEDSFVIVRKHAGVVHNRMYIILGIIIFIVLGLIFMYNSLVTGQTRVDEAWSDIEVQLKRRYDLIPNLVETVKGYAGHEKSVFENVTAARSHALGANTPVERARAENAFSDTLKTLFAVAENYPDLKANVNFRELQRETADTENKIQAARRFYNMSVRDYNISIQTFPRNIIAGLFGFAKKEFFDLPDGDIAEQPVQIKF